MSRNARYPQKQILHVRGWFRRRQNRSIHSANNRVPNEGKPPKNYSFGQRPFQRRIPPPHFWSTDQAGTVISFSLPTTAYPLSKNRKIVAVDGSILKLFLKIFFGGHQTRTQIIGHGKKHTPWKIHE